MVESFVVGDRVAVMREGRIVQVGRPDEVYRYPASAWVATFLGEANLLNGVGTNGQASTAVGKVPLVDPVRGPCQVVIRPEHLMVGRGDQGVISSVEFYGHDTSYELALDGARIMARVIAAPRFVPGDSVSVTYSGPEVVAFASGA